MLNIAMVAFISLISGVVLAIIILDRKKEDFEAEFDMNCTKSKHLFKHDDRRSEIYCFCGQEVLRTSERHDLYIIKS